jgi:hypothetical protein
MGLHGLLQGWLYLSLLQDNSNRLRDVIALHYSSMGNYSHTSAVTSKFHEQHTKQIQCGQHWRALQHGQTKLPGRATRFSDHSSIFGFEIFTIDDYEKFCLIGYNVI